MRRKLAISEIKIDETVLGRVQINEEVALDYETIVRTGAATLPAPDVFAVAGKLYLADGAHRLRAYTKAGAVEVLCEVHEGTLSDARWFAAAANLRHGLRPSREDKRRAVVNLLHDPAHSVSPDAAIALQCGVSAVTVGRIRKSLAPSPAPEPSGNGQPAAPRTVVDKRGRKMDVSRIGKGRRSRRAVMHRAKIARLAHREQATAKDAKGDAIPPNLRQAAEDAILIDETLTYVSGIAPWLERIGQTTAGSLLDAPAIMGHVNAIRALLKSARFYAVCACDGAGCPTCADRGWVTEREANNVPSLHQ